MAESEDCNDNLFNYCFLCGKAYATENVYECKEPEKLKCPYCGAATLHDAVSLKCLRAHKEQRFLPETPIEGKIYSLLPLDSPPKAPKRKK